jgi:hypothetical protein
MDRRLVAGAATAGATLLLALAAASGPVRLWITPPSDVSPSTGDTGPLDTVAPRNTVPPDLSRHDWGNTLLQILGVLLIVLFVTMVVWVVKAGKWPTSARRNLRKQQHRQIRALPELPELQLAVDVDAARGALAGGSPRNAIVACWMQLEGDVAAAGLPRDAAETSAEYVERVVAASSLEPGPIRELAALYREARFSRHDLRDDHRTRALAALTRVEAMLTRSVEVLA